jgi:hypothetical protein
MVIIYTKVLKQRSQKIKRRQSSKYLQRSFNEEFQKFIFYGTNSLVDV